MTALSPKNIADPSFLLHRDARTRTPESSLRLRDLHRFWDEAPNWRAASKTSIRHWHGAPRRTADITAVVVTWHNAPDPGPCLRALRAASRLVDEKVEIIVIANGPGGKTPDDYRGIWDRWIELHENMGPGPARNLGAELACGDIVAFVDDDGMVDESYFSHALPYFEDARVVGIRGRVAPIKHHYFCTLASHYDRGSEPLEDALITEGATLIRRGAFLLARGFPADIFGHEGIHLTFRLAKLHPQNITLYCPDVVLHHDFLTSWQEFFDKILRYARVESSGDIQTPEAARFLTNYFGRTFPRTPLPLHAEAVRHFLRILRTVVQRGAPFIDLFSRSHL